MADSGQPAEPPVVLGAEGEGPVPEPWVRLNVGGTLFTTTRATLGLCPDSVLAAMFPLSGPPSLPIARAADGAYLLDREPAYFGPLLSYLRSGAVFIDAGIAATGVLHEARAFGITPLVALLDAQLADEAQPKLAPALYLVVRCVTLYQAGRARTNIAYMGPLSRRKRERLEGVSLSPAAASSTPAKKKLRGRSSTQANS